MDGEVCRLGSWWRAQTLRITVVPAGIVMLDIVSSRWFC